MTLTALKVIALISMTIDHTLKIIITQPMLVNQFGMSLSDSSHLMEAMGVVGRIAYPIFAFCVAEGCIHTSNKKRYLLRLLAFAVISEVPFRLAFGNGMGFGPGGFLQNVIFTMLIGAIACMGCSRLLNKNENKLRYLAAAALVLALCVLAEILGTDYGGFGVLFIVVPYIITAKKLRMAMVAVLATVFYLGYGSFQGGKLTWLNGNYSMIFMWLGALAAVALLCFYNGQRGKKIKFSFYIYYPLHLVVLYAVQVLILPAYYTIGIMN